MKRLPARGYAISEQDERILRALRGGDRTWKELTAETGLNSRPLWRHLRSLQENGLITRVESTHHRRVWVYSILEPHPGFLKALELLESGIAKAGTAEETLKALKMGLFEVTRCMVEVHREEMEERVQNAMLTWSAFLWNLLLPGLLARVRDLEPDDVVRVLEQESPELAAVWKATGEPRTPSPAPSPH